MTQDGLPLTGAAYGTLDEDERGAIRYFRRNGDQLSEIDQTSYQDLPGEEQGPVRYFRILRGDGAQFPFDALGDSLDSRAYNRLAAAERGIVTGPGQRFRLRLSAPVFLNGTTLRLFVRNAASADAEEAWQAVEAGNPTKRPPATRCRSNVRLTAISSMGSQSVATLLPPTAMDQTTRENLAGDIQAHLEPPAPTCEFTARWATGLAARGTMEAEP